MVAHMIYESTRLGIRVRICVTRLGTWTQRRSSASDSWSTWNTLYDKVTSYVR